MGGFMSPELLSVRVASAVLPASPPSSWFATDPGAQNGHAPAMPKATRRNQSRAGHLAARHLVRQRHRLSPQDAAAVDIRHVAAGPERGRPFYCIGEAEGPFSLSISHAEGWAVAALARKAGERVGVDIEAIAHRDAAFEALALSTREHAALAGLCGVARWRAVTRSWVLKEALLKAVGIGLTVPLPALTVEGLEREDGPWAFASWTGPAADHPALAPIAPTAIDVAVFDVDELVGAWVVVPPEDGRCR